MQAGSWAVEQTQLCLPPKLDSAISLWEQSSVSAVQSAASPKSRASHWMMYQQLLLLLLLLHGPPSQNDGLKLKVARS